MTGAQRNPVTILLVEDDQGHARLIEKNLRRAGLTNEIVFLENGKRAVDFLFSAEEYQGQKAPANLLMLLDLNMPVMSGYQVLEKMKGNEQTRRIPVIVLTTTDDRHEIQRCYDLGCNIYITKPVEYEKFTRAVQQLGLLMTIMSVPNGK